MRNTEKAITNSVHVGALVVYRDITGTALHTAIVREARTSTGTLTTTYCMTGTPTLVESKWGSLGRYLHPPEIVPDSYGSPTYYQPPNRQPPKDTGDPGKDIHRLKED